MGVTSATPTGSSTYTPPAADSIGGGGQRTSDRVSDGGFSELPDLLRHDSIRLQREVLLWQRFVRYAASAVVAAAGTWFIFQGEDPRGWAYVLIASAAYLLGNSLLAIALKRDIVSPRMLAHGILWGDVAMITALVYLTSAPAEYQRILLCGLLVIQLSVFYFGTTAGGAAAALTALGYVLASRVFTPFVAGPASSTSAVWFNALLFLFVAAVLVFTFGNFRERLNKLRTYCKQAELGLTMSKFDDDEAFERRPDELTLLARSFSQMRDRLMEMIGTDPLTGCLNRRSLESRLSREWRAAKRRSSNMAVLAVDLDKFKPINDTYGHAAGDYVLRELAGIFREAARQSDCVARLGGDEFLMLLPDANWHGAIMAAERIRRRVDDHTFVFESQPLDVTISVGVAVFRGSDDLTIPDLLDEADRSLYRAKTTGRNRICA